VLGEPRHVTTGAGDEAVEGRRGRVQQLAWRFRSLTPLRPPVAAEPTGERVSGSHRTGRQKATGLWSLRPARRRGPGGRRSRAPHGTRRRAHGEGRARDQHLVGGDADRLPGHRRLLDEQGRDSPAVAGVAVGQPAVRLTGSGPRRGELISVGASELVLRAGAERHQVVPTSSCRSTVGMVAVMRCFLGRWMWGGEWASTTPNGRFGR
jgi:hypothetical protein